MDNLHVIVGLGVTGLSCARYLKENDIPIAVIDTRANPPHLSTLHSLYPDVPVYLGKLATNWLSEANTIILSPGIAKTEPAIVEQIKRGISVIGDIELFARGVSVPVIAITGTNAKSTVTTIVGNMAKAAGYQVEVGGNLGEPALNLLSKNPKTNLFVLELSSFQLETTYSLRPDVASILNISPDHMDRYKDFADYQRAKYRVYQHCRNAVCNRDDEQTTCHEKLLGKTYYFTLGVPKQNEFGLLMKNNINYLAFEDKPLLSVNDLPVKGKHYQANALASLAIGYSFGLAFPPMLQVLREFEGLSHRCQFVREKNGVRWYNDSKGTNVGATKAAIEGLGSETDGKLIMIMGGLGKCADFNPMVDTLEKYARHIILIGEAAEDIARAVGKRIPVTFAKDLAEAVDRAEAESRPRDCVLLSPACASYDMFKNYEHRGQVFMEIVRSL